MTKHTEAPEIVGRTPRSARVPPDPLSETGKPTRASAADRGVRPTSLALALLLILAAWIAPAQTPGNAENGKKLFLKNGCYECHGTMGQGGVGPRLAPRPLALAAIMAYVRKPSGNMPPYSAKIMPDAELADVRAYLVSIPEPPPAKSIPLLNQ